MKAPTYTEHTNISCKSIFNFYLQNIKREQKGWKKQRFRGFFCEQLQEASLYKSMFKKNTKSRLSVSPYFLCSLSTTSVVKLRDRQLICTMSKNHRRKHFLRSWLKSKVAQWPRFRRTGWCDLRSDLRRHPRPKFAKIVILSSLKDDHFFIP